jgi:hypothetical protein
MQQSKAAGKQSDTNRESTVYESRRLNSVRKNFAVGLQKEPNAPSPESNSFGLNNQTNRN